MAADFDEEEVKDTTGCETLNEFRYLFFYYLYEILEDIKLKLGCDISDIISIKTLEKMEE